MRASRAAFLNDESGGMAVVFSICTFVFCAIVALAITTADAYNVRGRTQQALDAAVLAGASAASTISDEDRIAIAQRVYASNATRRAGDPTVNANSETPSAFRVANYTVYGTVEFALSSPFLGIFGRDSVAVKVTSAARKRKGEPICVLGLDPTEEATMDFNGHASVSINNCASQANSSNGSGMRQVGQPSMRAKEIGVTGGYTGSSYSPTPVTGTNPIDDPYATLAAPSPGTCHPMSGAKITNETRTLTPGTYCGGLEVKAGSVVTLEPGIYIMYEGALTIDSQARVIGREVMIAFIGEGATMYILGGGSLDVTSPTSGTYANIQFFGDRNVYGRKQENLWFTVIGDSSLKYDGVLYAPSFHVWWAGGSSIQGSSPNYVAIAKKLWFQDHTHVELTQTNTRNLTVGSSERLQYSSTLVK